MNSAAIQYVLGLGRRRRRFSAIHVCAFLLVAGLTISPATAAEPWADSQFPVCEGLELWLDASRAEGELQLEDEAPLPKWLDASGKRRHLEQTETAAQPTLHRVADTAVIRFDGIDDCLRATNQAAQLRSFTIVIVAAPRVNIGIFRGLMALNAADQRDYAGGLTVDLGAQATARFSALNVEGLGFHGPQNLRTHDTPFGRLHALIITSNAHENKIRLAVDGQPEGERAREGSNLSMDEITVGARYYNNDAGAQHPNGFISADIAEIAVFNRPLNSDETAALQSYLDHKYAAAKDALPAIAANGAEPLVTVADPLAVQIFVPGFSVRELPIELSNVNNVKYRADGSLVALAYDGKIWLLRDTNGDRLEDKAELFWDNPAGMRSPIGMDLTPPGYPRGNGVFVVGKTRCLLVADTDGDNRADAETEVAGGWKESFHAVDGLGVCFDPRDGSVYYGRGTYNFADPLLRDKDGKPKYSLSDESGAIIHVSPDFHHREIVATGIRFPVALRFNRNGDLFATDQEGATWVPNGNPLDELLHIQKGRHYGFPARHPSFLPNVIDEPSTFDYSPQHQCTCGFNFNEPVLSDGPIFGPPSWAGDAFVAGYSRGKLYKTKLVNTGVGYVAATQILACFRMMPVDACISPAGDLIVACHSGGPDWGSGPTGVGKLFKIEYSDHDHPQPVFAWPTGPRELRVEFDRPVDPKTLREVLAKLKLTSGRYVRAGDRFESLWPGYSAVQTQKLAPRYDLPVRSAQLSSDRRSLILATDPIDSAVHYALSLPGMGRPPDSPPDSSLTQQPAIDLDFDLSGCEAIWKPDDGGPTWTGWLPHLDLNVSRELTVGSATHEALWTAMTKPGALTLRARLDLADMLHPAVQPGAKLDYEYPPEQVTVAFDSLSRSTELQLLAPTGDVATTNDRSTANFTAQSNEAKFVLVELRLKSTSGSPALTVHWTTNEDARPRSFPLRRMLLPWADSTKDAAPVTSAPTPPELAGGDWARGEREFFGEQAACSKCHTIRDRGGAIGPNLSNLIHRDYASVLRDITNPSFAINPDHLSHTIIMKDGRVLSGVVRTSGQTMFIGDANGKTIEVDRSDVDELEPSSVSIMPEGIAKQLSPDRIRDLMTFLLTQRPETDAGNPNQNQSSGQP